MKKIKFILMLGLILIFSQNNSEAQFFIENVTSGTRLKVLLENKLLVVLSGEEKFDTHLKSSFQKYWTVTKHEFIPYEEFDTKLSALDVSFFVPIYDKAVDNYNIYDKFKFAKTTMFALFNGGKRSIGRYNTNNSTAQCQVNGNTELSVLDAELRLDYIVKNLNDGLNIIRDKKWNEYNDSFKKEKNKKAGTVKEKTLLIDENLGKNKNIYKNIPIDLALFKLYPFKYKIVSHDEFVKTINSEDKEYCYFEVFLWAGSTIKIYDVETKELIYKSNPGNFTREKFFNIFIEEIKK